MGVRQPVNVAGIEFDALIESEETYGATVPQYPVDEGYSVQDNVALDPMELKMILYVTATPVTWLSRHGSGAARVEQVCSQLVALYESRMPIEVVTQDKSYNNMVIKSISIKKTLSAGYAREIPILFSQVTVTSAKTAAIPSEYVRAGKTQESGGNAQTQKAAETAATSAQERQSGSKKTDTVSTAQKNSTLLYDITKGIGSKTGWFSLD